MLKKSTFFDFLNRHNNVSFERFIADSVEDEHYINWNEFALPHDYGNAEAEYFAIRNSCAIFDGSPFSKIRIRGSGSGTFLDQLLTRKVSHLPTMRATYAIFCNEDGSLKDDAVLYRFDDDDFLLVNSDIDHTPYFSTLCERLELHDVSFAECTDSWAGLAVQGPRSAAVLLNMGIEGIEKLEPFEVNDYEFCDSTLRISRTGFTADLGYECWFEPDLAAAVMQRIDTIRSEMQIELPGYGLSAVQACRLEAGFIVAGWDCSSELDLQPGFERSPYELGLGWLVDLDGPAFVGREALLAQSMNGHPYTLRSFEVDTENAPADGDKLLTSARENAATVGIVNCSNWSWGLKKAIGNASIQSEHADLETAWIKIGGKYAEVALSAGPLVTLDRRNQVPAPVNF